MSGSEKYVIMRRITSWAFHIGLMERTSLHNSSWDQIGVNLERLDPEDVAHGIIAQYPNLDDFLGLSFRDMAEKFNKNGTSVPFLFDVYLEKGLNYYLELNPSHKEWFVKLEQILLSFVERSKSKGVNDEILEVRGLVKVVLPSMRPFNNTHPRAWGIDVDQRLLPEIFSHLLKEPLPGESLEVSQNFIIAMGRILYGNDRQFGYFGKRGSVLNSCIAKSHFSLQNNATELDPGGVSGFYPLRALALWDF